MRYVKHGFVSPKSRNVAQRSVAIEEDCFPSYCKRFLIWFLTGMKLSHACIKHWNRLIIEIYANCHHITNGMILGGLSWWHREQRVYICGRRVRILIGQSYRLIWQLSTEGSTVYHSSYWNYHFKSCHRVYEPFSKLFQCAVRILRFWLWRLHAQYSRWMSCIRSILRLGYIYSCTICAVRSKNRYQFDLQMPSASCVLPKNPVISKFSQTEPPWKMLTITDGFP
jgi:hypothetical protein